MTKRAGIETALRRLAPKLPSHEFSAVADHAMDSPGLSQATAQAAAWLSLVAYARHVFTDYEELLAYGFDRESARFFVAEAMNEVLKSWGVTKPVAMSCGGDEI